MGFSSYFRMMYSNDDGWLLKLLKFNIGVEIGQLFVLAIIIGIGHVVIRVLKVKGLYWSYALSMLSLLIAIRLIFDNLNQ
jgi:hypothetical protein